MRHMKILLMTDGITPFSKGGMQRHSQLIAEALASLGHQITVYHYTESNTKPNIDEAFSEKARRSIRHRWFHYSDSGRFPGHYVRAQKRMSQEYLKAYREEGGQYDFVYTKGFMGWALLNKRAATDPKIGVKLHGMNMFQPQPDWRGRLSKYLLRPIAKEVMRKSDVVFSYGGKITEVIKDHCKTQVLEIPTGIDKSWLHSSIEQPSDPIKFLFVGRHDRVKGLPELYDALRLLEKNRTDWQAHFVGPIPKEHRLNSDRVVFHGAIYDSSQLKNVYRQCDVLVNCSISEGMPNVILEAMACGLAVLATDVGATSVLVEDQWNGILINRADPHLIKNGLESMLDLPRERLSDWKSNSLEAAHGKTWETIRPILEGELRTCIQG